MQHHSIKETVVIQHKTTNGTAALIAYLAVGESDDVFARRLISEVPAQLSRSLPEYMIPTGFVVLEKLPRTANGKIDRKSLPAPSASSQVGMHNESRQFVPATTPTQQRIARIWAEVLELGQVSIHDSIFELGADSLLIFRIAARAQREGLAVNATLIFQRRTIAGVSEAIDADSTKAPVRLAARIAAAARDKYRLANNKVDA